jgi:putative oxidoreductase
MIQEGAPISTSLSFRDEWTPRLLSVLRIVVALLYLQHGLTKLFGFPGAAPANFHWFTLAPGLASLIETFGSLALLFGFYTRVVAFIMSGEMAAAYFIAHLPRGFFPYNNGGSLAVLYCFVFLYLALVGGGEWSVDAKLAKT